MADKKAEFWKPGEDKSVDCNLCPRCCNIKPDKRGFCQVRKNRDGGLYTLVYGHPAVLQIDPIEKKPLVEFMPGTSTFSIGTYGCNLNCSFCQNYTLSRGIPDDTTSGKFISPGEIVDQAIRSRCDSIAFTYNEPTVWVEYAIDIARLAKKHNLKTVLVSNGYITIDVAGEFYPLIDAANIDMKGFSEEFYSNMTGSSLSYVLDSIKYLYDLNKHLELTNLIIPGKNDDQEMIKDYLDWVEQELDKDVPLHFSAFYPTYKYYGSAPTPPSTLHEIKAYANERGFGHIYLGNI